jgi:putative nucleotidyltransferase with HDIG domain
MKLRLKNSGFWGVLKNLRLQDNSVLKVLIGISLVLLIVLMFPSNESIEFSGQVGSVWTNNDLIAPFSFPLYKDPHQLDEEQRTAVASVIPVVERRQDVEQADLESLNVVMANLREAIDAQRQWRGTRSVTDSVKFRRLMDRFPVAISDRQWSILGQWRTAELRKTNDMLPQFERTLKSILVEILRLGVVDSDAVILSHKRLALRKGSMEEIIEKQMLLDVAAASIEARDRLGAFSPQSDMLGLGVQILQSVLRPNIVYNRFETERLINVAAESVPRTLGFVQENERIVSKHDRITDEVKLKLDSFRKAKAEQGSENDVWIQRGGILLHVALVIGLFGIYLFLFRKKIFHSNAMLTQIALLLVMETFFAHLSISVNVVQPVQYLIFVPAASMLLAIIFDSRVALYGTVTMAFLIAGIRGNDYAVAISSLIAGSLGAYTVRDIRNRTQIFRSLGFIFLGYSASILALALERFESFDTIFTEMTFALANAVFSPVLTYGLLIFFERVFRVSTDLTLLELSDFNHPLLRQLSEIAPGTFHHSVTIGNLAEAAAEAVGANPILARVGAYYHDIGKLEKPEYFVENQTGSHSKHSKLKPRMSALVIISHVKEGIELARQKGLPERIVDFIPQHHGTNRISFFYDKALKQAAARKNPKDTVREEDFCYPGPKPQSKETAIVMLADLVEAATRTIEEITPQRLELIVENLIKQRFIEGQLDECELTLKDMRKIKEAFIKILIGIHHQRIEYPEQTAAERKTVQQLQESPVAATRTEAPKPGTGEEPKPAAAVPAPVAEVPVVEVAPAKLPASAESNQSTGQPQ